MKDRLFVEMGEDVDDAFAAFKHYKLNPNLTAEDRKRYGKNWDKISYDQALKQWWFKVYLRF